MFKVAAYAVWFTGIALGAYCYHLPASDPAHGPLADHLAGLVLPFLSGFLLRGIINKISYDRTEGPREPLLYKFEAILYAFGLALNVAGIWIAFATSTMYGLATLMGSISGLLFWLSASGGDLIDRSDKGNESRAS